jgi:hypothetical protein
MPQTWKILVGMGFVVLIGFIVYSATGLARVNCNVCVEFHGVTSCKPAAGTTQEEAIKTAVDIACSDLVSGGGDTRAESIACSHTPPKSIECK